MRTRFCQLAIAAFCCAASSTQATLLNVNPGYPKVTFSTTSPTALTYDPASQILKIVSTPANIRFSASEGSRVILGTRSLQISFLVDNTGAFVSGVPGDDFVFTGTFTRTAGGVTTTYSGILLTGEVAAFGVLPAGGTGQYDLRLTPTGGQLFSFFACGDLAINCTSDITTFTGTFATAFSGDAKGNAGLEDLVPPTITCPADLIVECHAFANGLPGAYVTFPTPAVVDNCDPNPTIVCTPAPGSFFALTGPGQTATYAVTCMATDASGNANSCVFNLTVQDTLPPQWADPNNPVIVSDLTDPIVLSNDPGASYATYSFGDPLATDNTIVGSFPTSVSAVDQTGATIQLTPLPNGDLQGQFPITTGGGENVITVTASDGRGNTAQHQAAVSVRDTENPTINCPSDQTVAWTGSPITFEDPTAGDNAPGVTVACVPANHTLVDPGSYPIICTATDASGNTAQCTFTLTILAQPTLVCPPDLAVPTAPGLCSAAVNYPAPTAGPNSPPLTITCVPASGSTFPKGQTTVTCTGKDSYGNTATCTFKVTVNDAEKPTITAPPNVVTSTDPGQCQASQVALGTPVTADNCGVAAVGNDAPPVFPKGLTTVTWTVTDTSGNQATALQTVTVKDKEQPTIAAPANVVVSTDPGQCQASQVTLGTPVTADNCGVAGVANDAPPVFPKGTTTVTWTVTDTSGNQATALQTVTVNDKEPPTITCPGNLKVLVSSLCASGTTVSFATPTATDNCGTVQIVCAPASGSVFPLGTTPVTCTATDGSGNQAQCTFTVTVQPAPCDPVLASLECSRLKFDAKGNSQWVWFRGNLTLAEGDQGEDFRANDTAATGAIKVTIGSTVVYCKDNVPFTVTDCDVSCDTEKWVYPASPTEHAWYRFKDDQHYSANKDPNLPVSPATGAKNVGNLETVFIGSDETRFRYAFQKASKPITIVVDGIVLLSVDANNKVTSAFPYWQCGKTVELLFPERLVPGNTIGWYATADPSNVSATTLIYSHATTANGNATDTYFNEGGRFLIKVPVAGLTFGPSAPLATVQITLGQTGTKVGCSSFTVTPMRVVGHCWKFGQCSDDDDEDDQEGDED